MSSTLEVFSKLKLYHWTKETLFYVKHVIKCSLTHVTVKVLHRWGEPLMPQPPSSLCCFPTSEPNKPRGATLATSTFTAATLNLSRLESSVNKQQTAQHIACIGSTMRLSNKKNTPVLPFFTWLKWAGRLYLPLQDRLRPAACPWRRWGYGQRPQVPFIDGILNAGREREEILRPALVHHIPAGLSQADAAAARCRGALGQTWRLPGSGKPLVTAPKTARPSAGCLSGTI